MVTLDVGGGVAKVAREVIAGKVLVSIELT